MKEKILEQLEKKITFKGVTVRWIPGISVETVEENNCQHGILYPVTVCFKIANQSSLTTAIPYMCHSQNVNRRVSSLEQVVYFAVCN